MSVNCVAVAAVTVAAPELNATVFCASVVEKPVPALRDIAKQFGFTQQSFDECLANQKVLDGIQDVRDRAAEKLGVNSTPTFFVNGKKLTGDQSIESLTKEISPYLKEG